MLVAKPGLDAHERGAMVLCQALRDAGMEVIYTGPHQTPETIALMAVQEDVDVVALSLLDGLHMVLFPAVVAQLRENGAGDVCVVGGGTIDQEDKTRLEQIGVTGNYGPGTPLTVIVEHIRSRVTRERRAQTA